MKNLLFSTLLSFLFLSLNAQTKTLTCDKSIYAPGSPIVFTYTNAVSTTDWIGIYTQGVIPKTANYQTWQYVPNVGNGTRTFTTTLAIGMYDSYFMCCDQYDSIFVKGPSFEISSNTAIVNYISNDAFNIFPNPTTASFIIEFSKETSGLIEVYDVAGRRLYSDAIKTAMKHPVSTIDFGKGIYFIKLSSNDNIYYQKLLVE